MLLRDLARCVRVSRAQRRILVHEHCRQRRGTVRAPRFEAPRIEVNLITGRRGDRPVIETAAKTFAVGGLSQLRALHEGGLRVQLLDELVDVDTYGDARFVAEQHPQTEFARTFQSFTTEMVG